MSAVGAFLAHADGAHGQGDVVVDDEEVLDGNLLLIEPVFHRLAAEVHIGGGLDHHEGLASVFHLRHLGQAAGGESSLKVLGQAVGDAKASVMPGIFIFGTDVSKTGDEVFHINNVET